MVPGSLVLIERVHSVHKSQRMRIERPDWCNFCFFVKTHCSQCWSKGINSNVFELLINTVLNEWMKNWKKERRFLLMASEWEQVDSLICRGASLGVYQRNLIYCAVTHWMPDMGFKSGALEVTRENLRVCQWNSWSFLHSSSPATLLRHLLLSHVFCHL